MLLLKNSEGKVINHWPKGNIKSFVEMSIKNLGYLYMPYGYYEVYVEDRWYKVEYTMGKFTIEGAWINHSYYAMTCIDCDKTVYVPEVEYNRGFVYTICEYCHKQNLEEN